MRNQRHGLSVRLTAVFIVIIILTLMLEAMARLVFAYKDELSSNLPLSILVRENIVLDPYEMASPSIGGHWVLRPGYQYDYAPGKNSGASRPKQNLFQINKQGIRGPDIDRGGTRPRILVLGDSVTFGGPKFTYPGVIQDVFDEWGVSVEVVNGGVEGYAPRNILYEIDRYAGLRPDVVTILIGWNALYSPALWMEKNEVMVRTLWFARNVSRSLYRRFAGEKDYAAEMRGRTPIPDSRSSDVMHAATYVPPFLGQIEKIIDRFEDEGSRIFLLTLPALFASDENPTKKALKIGHLPVFTLNPYVLAKITERYNQSLRDLASRRGLGLIDLAAWSRENLSPRDNFFSDSVHLTKEGLRRVGVHIAEELQSTILKERAQ